MTYNELVERIGQLTRMLDDSTREADFWRREHKALCGEVGNLRELNDWVVDEVLWLREYHDRALIIKDRLLPYIRHKPTCSTNYPYDYHCRCDCGFNEMYNEVYNDK